MKGEIVERAMEGEPHAYAQNEADEYLTEVLGNRAKIRQESPITLPNDSEPEPDIAIVILPTHSTSAIAPPLS